MTATMSDDAGSTFHKGLSEWWSEETEYVFQRIERWAAFARGYNRLRSQRLSRGRMTMQEEPESRWRIASNKLVIDDNSWSPRFHTLKKSRRKSQPEELRINCCGTLTYQSNSNLDSKCLETYRYDHSIYFKTIGDIRNSKKDIRRTSTDDTDCASISSEELVEWDAEAAAEFIADHFGDSILRYVNDSDSNGNSSALLDDKIDQDRKVEAELTKSITWPVHDFENLQIEQVNETIKSARNTTYGKNMKIDQVGTEENSQLQNNNYIVKKDEYKQDEYSTTALIETHARLSSNIRNGNAKHHEGFRKYLNMQRTRRIAANDVTGMV